MMKPGIPGSEPTLFDRITGVLFAAGALLQIVMGCEALIRHDVIRMLGSFGIAFILLAAVSFRFNVQFKRKGK